MCGFLVTPLNFKGHKTNEIFEKYISYRGTIPMNEKEWFGYNFMFSRLPIVDVISYQNQPFIYEDHILVFNGELYNHKEIKNYLENNFNINFSTKSDCEIFLKGFITLGPKKFFSMACGMWAYVISDSRGNVYWGRDEYGIKPLFFINEESNYFFSSSQRALLNFSKKREIDYLYLKNFLITGYQNPNKFSFYKGFEIVQPGYCYQYLKLKNKYEKEYCPFNDNSVIDKPLNDLINETFISQYPSEVKSTIALSGGLDSSGILQTFLLSKLNLDSLSLDLNASLKEKELINKTVKEFNVGHNFVKVSNHEVMEKCEDIVNHICQPLRSSQPVYQYFLRKKASLNGSKVFFTGDGADEIFGGYTQGFYFLLKEFINENKSEEFIRTYLYEFRDFLFLDDKDFEKSIYSLIKKKTEIVNLDKKWLSNFKLKNYFCPDKPKDLFEYCKHRLFDHPMPYWLLTEDVVSLLNGIETRVPFLDQRIVLKSKSLDRKLFYIKGLNKFHLRDAFKNLPKHIIKNKKKYPRPSDTSLLVFDKNISEIIIKFLSSPNFEQLLGTNDKLLKLYIDDKNNNISLRADNWFRVLSIYYFLKLENY